MRMVLMVLMILNLERMSRLGEHSHRWKDNIKIDIRETRCELDTRSSRQKPVVGTCESD
jgi:hypothetical protein